MSRTVVRVGKSVVLGSATLVVGLLGSSGAWAQCRDNFNVAGFTVGGQIVPARQFFPLAGGSALNALTSTINTVNTAFLTQTTAFVSAPGNPQPDQQGSGVWARGITGTVETNASTVSTIDLSKILFPINTTGTQHCDSTTRQHYSGYQLGHDISILNGGATGANWHWGVTAGYLEARTKDITPAGTSTNPNFPGIQFASPAGDFRETTQVPFVGLYTAFTKGGFFLDGQARWDFFQNELSATSNGLFGQELDARGIALTGNVGYNQALGGGWFLEPSAGVVWSRVRVDDLKVAGVGSTAFTQLQSGIVHIDDVESVLGRASLRVGTNFATGGIAWQPFFTASVFHEFAGDVTATSTIAGTGNPFIDGAKLTTNSSGGVGTYGQFALGTAAAIVNTGWLGYARVDYRVGENIEGWSVNGGLRYQFSPEQRGGIKDGPLPAVYSYNWTGPYIGVSAGAVAWGHESWKYLINNASVDGLGFAGALAGGQVGYNVQMGQVVVGIEGDYGWTNAHGGKPCPNAIFFACEVQVENPASVTGRVGVAWGRALLYGKAGWATADVALDTKLNTLGAIPPSNTRVNGSSATANGWTAGAGMEFALTNHVSAKAEYMYFDLGKDTFTVDNKLRVDGDTHGSTVRIGINLHFNPVQREALK